VPVVNIFAFLDLEQNEHFEIGSFNFNFLKRQFQDSSL